MATKLKAANNAYQYYTSNKTNLKSQFLNSSLADALWHHLETRVYLNKNGAHEKRCPLLFMNRLIFFRREKGNTYHKKRSINVCHPLLQ